MNETSTIRSSGMGVLAGIAGGVVLLSLYVAFRRVEGHDVWSALEMAGAPWVGARAVRPGPDFRAVGVGLGAHFAISAGWGLLFGLVFHGLSRLGTVVAGLVWGFAVWAVMFWLVLPLAGMTQVIRDLPVGEAVLGHLAFGLAVGVFFMSAQPARVPRRIMGQNSEPRPHSSAG